MRRGWWWLGWAWLAALLNLSDAKPPQSPRRRLPSALVVGVKKAGTRALVEYLRLHPDVVATGPEVHFFDRHFDRGLAWYRAQMPPSLEGQLRLEKTPAYWASKEVPPRVAASLPASTKLIVVVRDPLARAASDYAQASSKRQGMPSFQSMAFLPSGAVNASWGGIRLGLYQRQLRRWRQHFPRENFHFVSGEALARSPLPEMARVEEFLGLPSFLRPHHFVFNTSKGFPCLRTEQSSVPHCLGPTKGRPHPTLPEHLWERLRDFFRPHNQAFYEMVGRDFGW